MTLEDGRTFIPGQGNNAYVFPGVALGVIAGGVRHIPDEIFLLTAEVAPSLLPRVRAPSQVCDLSQVLGWPPEIPSLISSTLLPLTPAVDPQDA